MLWPKSVEHGRVAAQGGAVHFDETAFQLLALAFQFKNAAGEEGLAGAGRADQQHRRARTAGDLFDLLDHPVEGRVARGDAGLQEGQVVVALPGETLGDAVVA